MSVLIRLIEPFTELVRWGEPHDLEDDDPLFDGGASCTDDAFNLWA